MTKQYEDLMAALQACVNGSTPELKGRLSEAIDEYAYAHPKVWSNLTTRHGRFVSDILDIIVETVEAVPGMRREMEQDDAQHDRDYERVERYSTSNSFDR